MHFSSEKPSVSCCVEIKMSSVYSGLVYYLFTEFQETSFSWCLEIVWKYVCYMHVCDLKSIISLCCCSSYIHCCLIYLPVQKWPHVMAGNDLQLWIWHLFLFLCWNLNRFIFVQYTYFIGQDLSDDTKTIFLIRL